MKIEFIKKIKEVLEEMSIEIQNSSMRTKDDIIKLLEDKELANRLGNNAQIRIKKKFLWKD